VSFEQAGLAVERDTKAQTLPQNPDNIAIQGPKKAFRVGTLTHVGQTTPSLPNIGLYLSHEQALAGLAQKGSYLVSGYATLIVTSSSDAKSGEFILNTLTNGRNTGEITSSRAND
jgi:hypothetical protein